MDTDTAERTLTLPEWRDEDTGRFLRGNRSMMGPKRRVVQYIRQKCGSDAHTLVDALFAIGVGGMGPDGRFHESTERARDRIAACAELWDRGWGTPKQSIDLTSDGEPLRLDPRSLSDTDLATLLAILARQAQAQQSPPIETTARELPEPER